MEIVRKGKLVGARGREWGDNVETIGRDGRAEKGFKKRGRGGGEGGAHKLDGDGNGDLEG